MMNRALLERFKCADKLAEFSLHGELSRERGYFRLGDNAVGFGHCTADAAPVLNGQIPDVRQEVCIKSGRVELPFDPQEIADNLRFERYVTGFSLNGKQPMSKKVVRNAYYAFRPLFSVAFRRHLQRYYLRGWDSKPFPRWPVDTSVDLLLESCLRYAMLASGQHEVPFIWFWPDQASACALMTHDVETTAGRDFCPELMDINDEFKFPASFQVVPEKRYEVTAQYLEGMRSRGFEVAVQDFNHDGHLYSDRSEFERRATLIEKYRQEYQATGFRAAILYRNIDWLQEMNFSYDMSIPNVGHLDPQPGGCCTVFPYFLNSMLEIPVTTIQDYSLFNILEQFSVDLWKVQTKRILEKNGLMSFIIHPDYIIEEKPKQVYRDLLTHLCELRENEGVWATLPRELDRWWRARNAMTLVPDGTGWKIEGPESHRAQVAYASLVDGNLSYRLDS